MRIAVYSGTFNPLHKGHLAIMRHLSESDAFDWTYLVISPQNPLKDPSGACSARKRYHDAVDAVMRHPELKVWVDNCEFGIDGPSYTVRTLDFLKAREPENEFTLIIGADNLHGIRQWKDYARLLSEYGVSVYPRSGYDAEDLKKGLTAECARFRIGLLDCPTVDISSTMIREATARGEDTTELLM